jgi:NAD-reducing hydrogenase small subunit
MGKIRMATTWLDGCSGCHMSLLDMDEQLIDILGKVDIVYGPLVDAKVIPEGIDVVLVEGAVSTDADVEKLRLLRERSAILVSLGDCAVTANVPGMRNRFPLAEVLKRGYEENAP